MPTYKIIYTVPPHTSKQIAYEWGRCFGEAQEKIETRFAEESSEVIQVESLEIIHTPESKG